MPTRRQVQCVTKRDRPNPHERIEAIGGNDTGTPWYTPEDQAIRGIKAGTMSFFTLVNGRQAEVIVASHSGREYLKTDADGYAPNNLLSLSTCPIRRAA